MKFDETDLELFRHIAEAGSITHGAGRTNMALTAASARVRSMEARLGVDLFERKRHGVVLTPAGRVMLTHAKQLLAQANQLREDLGMFQSGLAGHIRVFANTNSYATYLPGALGSFLVDHPGIDIHIAERPSETIIGLVADGTAEIGIVAAETDLAGLTAAAVVTDRYVVVTSVGHPIARSKSAAKAKSASKLRKIDFADTLDREFVAGPSHPLFAAKAQRLGKTIKARIRMRDDTQVCQIVSMGVGIGIVPMSIATTAQLSHPLSMIELRDAWALRRMFACIRDRASLTQPALLLYDHLALKVSGHDRIEAAR